MRTRDGKNLDPAITLHFTRQMLDNAEFEGRVEHGLAKALEAALEENIRLTAQLSRPRHWWHRMLGYW